MRRGPVLTGSQFVNPSLAVYLGTASRYLSNCLGWPRSLDKYLERRVNWLPLLWGVSGGALRGLWGISGGSTERSHSLPDRWTNCPLVAGWLVKRMEFQGLAAAGELLGSLTCVLSAFLLLFQTADERSQAATNAPRP